MKTGQVAQALGLNTKTITNWSGRPEFAKYLSPAARKQSGDAQREYTDADVSVLKTIHHLRFAENVTDWQTIAEYLETGQRVTEIPASAAGSDTRTVPLPQAEQSARAAATLAERNAALAEVERLRGQLDDERTRAAAEKDKLMERIIELSMRVGLLEGELKALRGDD